MFNNIIDNVQMSWVKEGQKMSQLLLRWGANDFGGTLINESISTSAGSEYGQLLKPKEIRRMIKEIGRIPVERNTNYKIIKKFNDENEVEEELDKITDTSQFGSYVELVKINKFNYKNPRIQ
jgi:FO synthase subunit 2